MGLYVNATDGTVNAVQNDFVNAIKLVIEENDLPLTREVVDELLSVTGVSSRYSHTPTITSIKNELFLTRPPSLPKCLTPLRKSRRTLSRAILFLVTTTIPLLMEWQHDRRRSMQTILTDTVTFSDMLFRHG